MIYILIYFSNIGENKKTRMNFKIFIAHFLINVILFLIKKISPRKNWLFTHRKCLYLIMHTLARIKEIFFKSIMCDYHYRKRIYNNGDHFKNVILNILKYIYKLHFCYLKLIFPVGWKSTFI